MKDTESAKEKAAELIFTEIEAETKSTKTKNVLRRIREACDFYERERVPITMARVGRYWEQRGGGVHAQSIRNNQHFRKYVLARAAAVSSEFIKLERRKTPQEQGNEYIVLAEMERYKVVAEALKKVIERGKFDLEKALQTGELVPLNPEQDELRRMKPVMDEALNVIQCVFDGERLEHFGLYVEGERVISLEGREFLSKRDYRSLRAALDLRKSQKGLLPPVSPSRELQRNEIVTNARENDSFSQVESGAHASAVVKLAGNSRQREKVEL